MRTMINIILRKNKEIKFFIAAKRQKTRSNWSGYLNIYSLLLCMNEMYNK